MAKDTDTTKTRRRRVVRATAPKTPTLPSPAQVAKILGWTPGQTPLRYLLRYLPGHGIDTFVSILQASESEPVQRFVRAYVDMTHKERKKVDLEQLCESCAVHPSELIAEFSKEAFDMGADMARAIAGLAQVPIMAASVQMSMEHSADGRQERAMHFAATRFTPVPKGTLMVNNPNFNVVPKPLTMPQVPALGDVPDFVLESRQLADRARAIPETVATDLVPVEEK